MPSSLMQFLFLLLLPLPVMQLISCNGAEKTQNNELSEKLQMQEKELSSKTKAPQNPELNQPVENARQKSNLVVSVVKEVMPAVVSIHSEKLVEVPQHRYFNPFEELFGGRGDNEPQKYKQQGLGSGVIIDSDGYIITNHHVAGEADDLLVTLSDNREFEAKIVGTDKHSDLAVIKIKKPPTDLPVATLGNSDVLEIGETVLAIGNPFGYSNTVTMGILSAKQRVVGVNSYENYLQTDASINPGNSGGALINLNGEVIGINTVIASRSGGSQGVGFAIPVNMARTIMQDLLRDGTVTRGFLGVYLEPIDKNLASALNLENNKGALVSSVMKGSPAEDAGLKDLDVIVEVEGNPINNINELRNTVAMLKPGEKIKFKYFRDGNLDEVTVKIGTREDGETAKKREQEKDNDYGMTLSNIDIQAMRSFGLPSQDGVIVLGVEPGSLSDDSGLRRGDVILEADKKTVKDVAGFFETLDKFKGAVILLRVQREGRNMFIGFKF